MMSLRAALVRAESIRGTVEDLLKGDPSLDVDPKVTGQLLRDKLDRLEKAFVTVSASATTPEEHEQVAKFVGEYTVFSERAEDFLVRLMARVQIQEPKESPIKAAYNFHVPFNAKLPTLELGKFDGEPLHFSSFWSSFMRRIDSQNIPAGDKFEYLRQSLNPEVGKCISGMIINEANYLKAKEILESRYGDKDRLLQAHREAIILLKSCGSSTRELSSTFYSIEEHLNNLESLKDVSDFEEFLPLIKSKFPPEIRISIEESLGEKEVLTLGIFRKKLARMILIRERNEKPASREEPTRERPWVSWRRENKNANSNSSFSAFNPRGNSTVLSTSVETSTRKPNTPCIFCESLHWNDDCDQFTTLEERRRKLFGRCFICLSTRHMSLACHIEKPCYHCGAVKKHHRSLCPDYIAKIKSQVKLMQAEIAEVASVKPAEETLVAVVSSNRDTYVPAGIANVSKTVWDQGESVKFILDTASQSTFVTENLAKRLSLKICNYIHLDLTRFGATVPVSTICPTSEIYFQVKGEKLALSVIIVPHIASQLVTDWYYSEIFRLKEKYPHMMVNAPPRNGVFDVLIGVDYYYQIVGGRTLDLRNGMFLSETRVGFLLVGKKDNSPQAGLSLVTQSVVGGSHPCVCWPKNVDLSRYWDLELVGLRSGIDDGEKESVEFFNRSIDFRDNRYLVSWPWKSRPPSLPNNFDLAFYRLRSVYQQLVRNKELTEYNQVFQDQEASGIIEKVEGRSASLEHYLPHLSVKREGQHTTKLRVVFDASAKARKTLNSLNDCLLKGRTLLEELFLIVMRFRLYSVVLLADIEKAFLQLELKEIEDRDVARFLWLRDLSKGCSRDNIQIFRFKRVAFGVVSSPFLLNAVIRYHINRHVREFPQLVRLKHAIYVDNLVLSVPNDDVAQQVYRESKILFERASMNLREWTTNSPLTLDSIAQKDRAGDVKEYENVLGLLWCVKTDRLFIKSPEVGPGACASKRTVLQYVASVFDPFGFAAPSVLLGKLLLRELWTCEYGWDDKLSTSHYDEWVKVHRMIGDGVGEIRQPRCFEVSSSKEVELHVFTDASEQAYQANVYLRIIRPDGKIDVYLVLSKNRVAPISKAKLKTLTIPRLELLAICIGCRALQAVRSILGEEMSAVLWSDSQCALGWVRTEKILPLYEENRVKNIRTVANVEYRYIPGELNPADLATRKIKDNNYIKESLWWQGPTFLKQEHELWPTWEFNFNDELFQEDVTTEATVIATQPSIIIINPPFEVDISSYSSLNEFLLDCWYSDCNDQDNVDLEWVLNQWLIYVQRVSYPAEVSEQKVRERSKLRLWLEDGLLKCSNRLNNSALSDSATFPILLPKDHRLTFLIVMDVHTNSQHVGANHTLALLRHKFFISRGLAVVTKVLKACVECAKMKTGPYRIPDMPALPKERVLRFPPFTHVGLDGLGPFVVRSGPQLRKVWVIIITCLATRAVYLNVMDDLSAEHFLYVLREFIGRHTCPVSIVCDNALAFKTVATVSRNIWWRILRDDGVQNYSFSSLRRIQWRFIPSYSPFMGGVYERLVALVKDCLYRSTFGLTLTYFQFRAFISETQGILNNRPICPLDDGGLYLTPNHFLNTPVVVKGPFIAKDDRVLRDRSLDVFKFWKKGVRLLDHFWQIWSERYLIFLTNRRTWKVKQGRIVSKIEPRIGEVVMVGAPKPRPKWSVGRIELLEGSRDGKIRSAVVVLDSGEKIRRSVGDLYPFEANVQDLFRGEPNEEIEEESPMEGGSVECVDDPEKIVEEEMVEGLPAKIRSRRGAVSLDSGSPRGLPSPSPPLSLARENENLAESSGGEKSSHNEGLNE